MPEITRIRLTCYLMLPLWLAACGVSHTPAPVEQWQSRKHRQQGQVSGTHLVQKGDTLFSIAFRSGQDYRRLAQLNNIKEPYTIYIGQKIRLSGGQAYQTNVRGPVTSNPSSNKNHSNSSASDASVNTPKLVALQKQKGYVQVERVEESEKTADITTNRNVTQWLWPVQGPILAKFSNQEHGNKGLDIGGALGTPIRAAAAGQVVYAGSALRGYGNLVIIKHNDDYLSAYAHNHRILVSERAVVQAGQIIAEMGNTDAERIQLHFEIRYRGQSVDPLRFLKK